MKTLICHIFSSIAYEGIRAILNLFISFYKKISHAQKA